MANDNTNIMIAGDAILTVAKGNLPKAQWPTTATGELDAAFADGELGLITSDGENFTREVSTENLDAHQQTSVRTVVSGGEMSLNFSAMETNEMVEDLWFGADLGSNTYRDVKADGAQVITFVYDAVDTGAGFEKNVRYVGVGLITPDGEISYTRTEQASYPFKISIMGEVRYISEKAE